MLVGDPLSDGATLLWVFDRSTLDGVPSGLGRDPYLVQPPQIDEVIAGSRRLVASKYLATSNSTMAKRFPNSVHRLSTSWKMGSALRPETGILG